MMILPLCHVIQTLTKGKAINTEALKKFVSRRRWQVRDSTIYFQISTEMGSNKYKYFVTVLSFSGISTLLHNFSDNFLLSQISVLSTSYIFKPGL